MASRSFINQWRLEVSSYGYTVFTSPTLVGLSLLLHLNLLPVTLSGFVMPSWFDIQEMPITAVYPDLGHSISDEELQHMESWIISRLQSESSA
uniref:Uncharacterized protein n=1 Tax=Lactuca sativa TaxID=4236 RepID=A0A9R1XY76_LACSA|nr:hypothetical protein LSAT_V11C100049920 [Lactuca sativa]